VTALTIQLLRLPHSGELPLPKYQSTHAAGMDLLAAVPADAPVAILPGARALIPTGIAMALPDGYEAQVRPRSGLAAKYGVTVLNAPGTIDADYRGEVQVLLVNLGAETFTVERGSRIAQLIVAQVAQVTVAVVETLGETARGEGGFGSTGGTHSPTTKV
jgi:dUTP pyrophosphatase